MDISTALVIGMFTGIFGMAYLVYAKKTGRIVPGVAGILLCVFPYFVSNLWFSLVLFAAGAAAPWLIQL